MLPCPAQGPVSRSRRSPERFSLPKRRSKGSNLMIRELCYSRIFKLKKGSLHTKGFRRINFCVFRYRLIKNCFAGNEPQIMWWFIRDDDSYYCSVCRDSHAVSWVFGKLHNCNSPKNKSLRCLDCVATSCKHVHRILPLNQPLYKNICLTPIFII